MVVVDKTVQGANQALIESSKNLVELLGSIPLAFDSSQPDKNVFKDLLRQLKLNTAELRREGLLTQSLDTQAKFYSQVYRYAMLQNLSQSHIDSALEELENYKPKDELGDALASVKAKTKELQSAGDMTPEQVAEYKDAIKGFGSKVADVKEAKKSYKQEVKKLALLIAGKGLFSKGKSTTVAPVSENSLKARA